jgi:succinoglycan biosynthesis protein ExoA
VTQTFPTTAPTQGAEPVPAGPSPALVLVAVPALNEARNIRDCLASLLADPWMGQVPVVVADGGSTDTTREIVEEMARTHPNIRLIDNPGRLQSAAVNLIAETCADPEAEVLLRCDAHATYPPGYVRQVATALLANPQAASLATPMDACGTGCFQRAVAWIVDTPLGSGGSAHRGGQRSQWVDHGHHAGFRLDWFRKVGGYDESFSHNEDAEYDHRLGLAGGKVWLDAGIRLDYRVRPTPRGLARQYWNYGRGRARNVLKHRMRPRLRQMIPVVNLSVLSLSLLLSPLLPALLLLPLAYLAVLALVSLAGAAKLGSACGLWAGVALGIMHNAWGAGFLRQALAGGAR